MVKKEKWIGAFEFNSDKDSIVLSVEVNILSKGVEQPVVQKIIDAAKAQFNRAYTDMNYDLILKEI